MARFVIAQKRLARVAPDVRPKHWNWAEVLRTLGPRVKPLHEVVTPKGDNVRILLFEASATEIQERSRALPSWVRLEPEIDHRPAGRFRPAKTTRQLQVRAVAGRRPLAGALVALLRGIDDVDPIPEGQGQTDEHGRVVFAVDPAEVARVIVSPVNAYWPMIVDGPGTDTQVTCPEVPFYDDGLGWWHRRLGIRAAAPKLGAGIRVGVLDTGLGEHEALAHVVRVGAWLGGRHDRAHRPNALDALHGTHVCGIIGARPPEPRHGYWGVAPGVELLAGCVCKDGESNQQNIAEGVLALAGHDGESHQVDLINLSLSATIKSSILLDAIADVADLGCLCICAAGNTRRSVEWPARSTLVVAVSAFGQLGFAPAGSLSESCLSEDGETGEDGEVISLARFNCHGHGMACCGPGVGMISTLPRRTDLSGPWWGVMDGTSMAAPAVCGVLAARLAGSAGYLQSRRDRARYRAARRSLFAACRRPEGWHRHHVGRGCPRVN
jgi:subtilisin family serine protease